MNIIIQWVELEGGAWESVEGRFTIHPEESGYTVRERRILYSPYGESVPVDVKVDEATLATVDECKEWAHQRLERHWQGGDELAETP